MAGVIYPKKCYTCIYFHVETTCYDYINDCKSM